MFKKILITAVLFCVSFAARATLVDVSVYYVITIGDCVIVMEGTGQIDMDPETGSTDFGLVHFNGSITGTGDCGWLTGCNSIEYSAPIGGDGYVKGGDSRSEAVLMAYPDVRMEMTAALDAYKASL